MIECFLADRRSEDEININKNIIPLEFRIDRSHLAPISHISAKKTKYLMKKKVFFLWGKGRIIQSLSVCYLFLFIPKSVKIRHYLREQQPDCHLPLESDNHKQEVHVWHGSAEQQFLNHSLSKFLIKIWFL